MNPRILTAIYIYPIKSLSGLRLKDAFVEERGLRYDRRWMLIDKENNFITLRKMPRMVFFNLKSENDGFRISGKDGHESIIIPWEIDKGEKEKVRVWNDHLEAIAGAPEWNDWFSHKLNTKCKLVFMRNDSERYFSKSTTDGKGQLSFADGSPYLITGEASLRDLNAKMEHKIEIERFRPNLVFTSGLPYEELSWKKFKVGDVTFRGIKPCTRCVVTTIDPQTGKSAKEPLSTLSKQNINGKAVFGLNAMAVNYGIINIGDLLEPFNQ